LLEGVLVYTGSFEFKITQYHFVIQSIISFFKVIIFVTLLIRDFWGGIIFGFCGTGKVTSDYGEP